MEENPFESEFNELEDDDELAVPHEPDRAHTNGHGHFAHAVGLVGLWMPEREAISDLKELFLVNIPRRSL